MEIHPFLGVTETYDDNIYRSYGGREKEADWVTTISPGIQLRLPLQRHSVQLDYRADVNVFARNRETNFANQVAGGAVNLDFAGGLKITVSDSFTDAVIPRRGKEVQGVSGASDPFRDHALQRQRFHHQSHIPLPGPLVRRGPVSAMTISGTRMSYDEGGTYNRNNFGGTLIIS